MEELFPSIIEQIISTQILLITCASPHMMRLIIMKRKVERRVIVNRSLLCMSERI